jgi:DNA-binding CsgD family transcriptional regulator
MRSAQEELDRYRSVVPYSKDVIAITAVDPDGLGIGIVSPSPRSITISGRAKERWQMLGAHVHTALRLRHGLRAGNNETDLPHGADAVIDPQRFRIVEASGPGKSPSARATLREAALRIDRARGMLRKNDPLEAIELWTALVVGRWSMVDWFDSDQRRYVLAVRNEPHVTDPRGLTERELQVVVYVVFGLTNKMVAYYLGISTSRVSTLLRSAMRKLNVQTRSALIKMFREFESIKAPT